MIVKRGVFTIDENLQLGFKHFEWDGVEHMYEGAIESLTEYQNEIRKIKKKLKRDMERDLSVWKREG